MIKLVVGLIGMLCVSGLAVAGGDAQAGKNKAVTCVGCHGADGNSALAMYPKLAGQNEKYLLKQLRDVKSGTRPIALMAGQLDNKSDQDLADIAAYFASLNMSLGAAKADLVPVGEKLYRSGNKDNGVAACTACHSPTGSGNGPAGYPKLGGQHADYVAAQLKAFRAGERVNDGDSKIMRNVALNLKDQEIEAVASYISGLH